MSIQTSLSIVQGGESDAKRHQILKKHIDSLKALLYFKGNYFFIARNEKVIKKELLLFVLTRSMHVKELKQTIF